MKNGYVDYICSLYGYLIRLQEFHWNTTSNSEHVLCDEIYDLVKDCMDRFAECAQGIDNTHFKVGDLKPMLPNAESLIPMMKELESETMSAKDEFNSKKEAGLQNVIDDILEACGKYRYRATQVGHRQ